MSIDLLQQRIRKLKNPVIVELGVMPEQLPPHLLSQNHSFVKAHHVFCAELIEALKGLVPAVRFRMAHFALMGQEGLESLRLLLELAKKDFYVIVDAPDASTPALARLTAETMRDYPCDAITVSPYIGSDAIKAFSEILKQKALFVTLRTANKSASEMQDLMTGSRLVHIAAADTANRLGEELIGRSGYSQIAGIGAANAPESLRQLRSKFNRMFLLVEGMDYSNANSKNCSYAFDKLGHGASVCVASSVTAAWTQEDNNSQNYIEAAVEAMQKVQKNLLRYISIL